MKTDVVLLPGLHGSTTLFEGLVALAPAWARCWPMALPVDCEQSFDALAEALEPRMRSLEGIVLFAESFSAPVAARLSLRLKSKVALLVLCNPLIEPPISFAPSFGASLLQSRWIPVWAVAQAMTGGDRRLAAAVLRFPDSGRLSLCSHVRGGEVPCRLRTKRFQPTPESVAAR